MRHAATESAWRRLRGLRRHQSLKAGYGNLERLRGRGRQRIVAARASQPIGPGLPPFGVATVLLLIYRKRNARYVLALLADLSHDAEIRLWALDEVEERLAPWTLGHGPGAKFELLNKLLAERPVPADGYVVVADDDVVFRTGDIAKLVTTMREAGIDLAQPAHSLLSVWSHPVTIGHPGIRASLSNFVEIGPLFAVSPFARPSILPFGEDIGMGWGLPVVWYHLLSKAGARMGIIDSCRMMHCEPVGVGYDTAEESRRLRRYLDDAGLRRLADIKVRTQRWWRWQSRPAWTGR